MMAPETNWAMPTCAAEEHDFDGICDVLSWNLKSVLEEGDDGAVGFMEGDLLDLGRFSCKEDEADSAPTSR